MEKKLSPETIYSDVKSKEISKNIAVDQLLSLIEGSNNPKIRSESIFILNKLNFREPRTFKTIENSLLSDESPIVRISAVNLIGHQFLKEGIEILTWTAKHEKSPLVIKAIFDLNLDLTDTRLKPLNEELTDYLTNIASNVEIITNEAMFILELEAIFAQTEDNYELDLESYKLFTKLKDQKLRESWLTIKDRHIEALSFNYFNWRYIKRNPNMFDSISNLQDPIMYLNLVKKFHLNSNRIAYIPNSIFLLTKLKKLNLCSNNFREIPKSIFFLSSLNYLDLSYNRLKEIPEDITKLKSLTTLKIQNNQISEIPLTLRVYLDKLKIFKI